MKPDAANVRQRGTTSAIGPDGRQVYFDDVVRDGEIVEVAGRRMVVIYDPMAPDWFVFEARGGAAIPAGPEVASVPTGPASPEGVTLNPIPSGGPGSERPVTNAPAVGRPRLKSKTTGAPDAATHSDEREFTQITVELLEVLLDIAKEYRRTPVSDGRPRMRQRKLLARLEASHGE